MAVLNLAVCSDVILLVVILSSFLRCCDPRKVRQTKKQRERAMAHLKHNTVNQLKKAMASINEVESIIERCDPNKQVLISVFQF